MIRLNKNDVRYILSKSFPEYKGRKFVLELVKQDEEISVVSYWSGGTKDSFVVVNEEGSAVASSAQFHNLFPTIQISADPKWKANNYQVLVKRSYFCGHDCGITIYATTDSELIPKNLLV